MSVRPARPTERRALASVQASLSEPNPELLRWAIDAGNVLVSTADDRPVGYLLAVYGDSVHVAEIAVRPDHRREGRASALLSRLVSSLETGSRITVAVEPGNEAARELYRSTGFERLRRDESYFESGAALILARRA
ncbi:GNAT family N-acetyltransferase [Haloprofundus salinisoli]|uniref:GNAT family N-acetyltransferase n=1 Tax=Haloprofundus salinisoli TaxID=2876193 RepID=UPI001CCE1FF5|nr:GNAT family N-acetyltransferase [Haloprofundus salinisoli]